MSDLFRTPMDVPAPKGAYGWTPEHGFITSPAHIATAFYNVPILLEVEGGKVEDVEGLAPLYTIVRLDREVLELRRLVAALLSKVEILHERIERQP